MRPRLSNLWRSAAALLLALAMTVLPVQGQQDDSDKGPFREPGIRYRPSKKPYVQWIAGSAIIVACLLAAAKNPHRTHLD